MVSPVFCLAFVVFLSFAGLCRAESALEASGSCRAVANGERGSDGTLRFSREGDFCWGAFASLQQLARVSSADNPKGRALNICAPPESTRMQLVLVYLQYATNHPNELHEELPIVAWRSLMSAFPCSK